MKSVIDNLEFWKWFFLARNIILIHLAIWLTLILAYPISPQVQTIFWNPWVRRILGFGYIGLLLTWVPYLRRRLFEPFKPILLAHAGLDNFSSLAYFPQSGVVETRHGASLHQDVGEIRPITQAIPSITGQIVLEGELKNYLEKSIWEDLEKRDFEVAIALLRVIACNEHFRQGITEQALLNQLKDNFTTSQCLDACLWLTNVGLLYHEEVEHQDFYQIRIPLLSRWIQMQMTEEEIEQCKISH